MQIVVEHPLFGQIKWTATEKTQKNKNTLCQIIADTKHVTSEEAEAVFVHNCQVQLGACAGLLAYAIQKSCEEKTLLPLSLLTEGLKLVKKGIKEN